MALERLERDPAAAGRFGSPVPPLCRTRPCALGVDEAGRGPVLGPMVYAMCYCPLEAVEELRALGVADSKTLSEPERERRFSRLEAAESVGWGLHLLPPERISACMLQRAKFNLNELSQDAAAGLIQFALDGGVNVAEVFVDTVGPADKYAAKLRSRFPGLEVTVRPKADGTFAVVSAASICAKVARDRAVAHWRFPEDPDMARDYGSGYPNDPQTRAWLRQQLQPVFGFPRFVRFSWGTARELLRDRAVAVTWADEAPAAAPAPPALLSRYFRGAPRPPRAPHRFFQERSLRSLSDL